MKKGIKTDGIWLINFVRDEELVNEHNCAIIDGKFVSQSNLIKEMFDEKGITSNTIFQNGKIKGITPFLYTSKKGRNISFERYCEVSKNLLEIIYNNKFSDYFIKVDSENLCTSVIDSNESYIWVTTLMLPEMIPPGERQIICNYPTMHTIDVIESSFSCFRSGLGVSVLIEDKPYFISYADLGILKAYPNVAAALFKYSPDNLKRVWGKM